MRTITFLFIFLFVFNACKKSKDDTKVNIPGGKGGAFHIAVFPLQGQAGVSGKVFIKYGTQTIPSSYDQYDDSSSTMTEPGFGPHAHFLSLKPGFYAIAAYGYRKSIWLSQDTLIEIRDTQAPSVDYHLQLK